VIHFLLKNPAIDLMRPSSEFADLSDPRVVRAIKKAVKGKAPGKTIKVKVALPPKGEKKRRKR
jgi:hypothetical protein